MKTETTADAMAGATTLKGYPCSECGKTFSTQNGVTMHINRVHTKKIKVPWEGKGKGKKKTRSPEELNKRREYQRKLRERYKKEGKDSRGYPLKKPNFGSAWTPARRRKFRATWEAKKNGNKTMVEIAKLVQKNEQPLEDPRELINHCPECGKSLIAYYLAAGAERRRHGK